jgi:hypothetical protein
MPKVKPKLPCPVCGARDVLIVAAVPKDDSGYALVTLHTNGDECNRESSEVTEAAWRAYEARCS